MSQAVPPNPFVPEPTAFRGVDPACFVIFGASGDLTRRKLFPALYRLSRRRLLDKGTSVVGYARKGMTDESFRSSLKQELDEKGLVGGPGEEAWRDINPGVAYVTGDFGDPAGYTRLRERLATLDQERGTRGNRLFYLATPPSAFPVIIEQLERAGLVARGRGPGPWTRVIVEKPFGRDLASASALNEAIAQVFREDQTFRIDHYLGKETVQNILVFRLANGIFEPLWNNRYVDHIQITVAETLGVEGRGSYFEEAGILRDMVQSHVLQLLALVAMEPPVAFEADRVRDEKIKVLRSAKRPIPEQVAQEVVGGQYGPGSILGKPVPGYREEPGVATRSVTSTYVAWKVFLENWRWAGVPFYLRVAKRLPKRVTEIAIVFKQVPHSLFREAGCTTTEPNVLVLRIQPDEGISLTFGSKAPGPRIQIDPVRMDFLYSSSFGEEPAEAYERLLLDALRGDGTLFARRDEVEVAWSLVDAVIAGWERLPPTPLPNYPAGTWGPPAAEELIRRDGRAWRRP